jgi:seryl-tRNA synthetase
MGTPPTFDFDPKAHWDLGPDLGIIDLIAASKSRALALFARAVWVLVWSVLLSLLYDIARGAGFKEWWPPVITTMIVVWYRTASEI